MDATTGEVQTCEGSDGANLCSEQPTGTRFLNLSDPSSLEVIVEYPYNLNPVYDALAFRVSDPLDPFDPFDLIAPCPFCGEDLGANDPHSPDCPKGDS